MAVGKTVPVPEFDAAGQLGLDSASEEACEDAGVQSNLLQSPHEEELLSSFLHYSVCLKCRGEVLTDVDTEALEAADPFNHFITSEDLFVPQHLAVF